MSTPANPGYLTAWLQAQLDTDVRLIDEYEAYMTERAAAAGSYVLVTPPGWQPGEPFDPDRQRAEVDAKRRIMAIHHPRKFEGMGGLPQICDGCGYGGICDDPVTEDINDCPILRLLALPYADREGFREEWRPA